MSGPNPPSPSEWLKAQRNKAATATPKAPAVDTVAALDSQTEKWLQQYGVKYAPKTMIPMSMIDEKGSLTNQARSEPLVAESVEAFTLALKAGEYLPAIVVFPYGSKVRIVDGNNRHASHKKNGSQFIPGFVIDEATPSETIKRLTVNANVGHGVRPDEAWRVRQAVDLIGLGFTLDQACKDAQVTKSKVQAFQAQNKATDRAKALKIGGFGDLVNTSRGLLGALASDPVFYQAARTAVDTGMKIEEVRIFVRDIKGHRDESSQIEYIGKIAGERRLEEQQRKAMGKQNNNAVSSPKNSLVSALGKLLHVDVAALDRSVITQAERQEIVRRCYQASEVLLEVTTALELRDKNDG